MLDFNIFEGHKFDNSNSSEWRFKKTIQVPSHYRLPQSRTFSGTYVYSLSPYTTDVNRNDFDTHVNTYEFTWYHIYAGVVLNIIIKHHTEEEIFGVLSSYNILYYDQTLDSTATLIPELPSSLMECMNTIERYVWDDIY